MLLLFTKVDNFRRYYFVFQDGRGRTSKMISALLCTFFESLLAYLPERCCLMWFAASASASADVHPVHCFLDVQLVHCFRDVQLVHCFLVGFAVFKGDEVEAFVLSVRSGLLSFRVNEAVALGATNGILGTSPCCRWSCPRSWWRRRWAARSCRLMLSKQSLKI